jgi:small-conductance mechanosensitive channel
LNAAAVVSTLSPATWAQIHEAAVLVGIALLTLVAARVAMARVPRLFPSASLISSLVGITIGGVGVLVALDSLGISVTPILTALGVGGLAVALALRGTLANVFAGLEILASREVRPGDFIRFDGGEGYVADITWRSTAVVDVAGGRVIVPNEKLVGAVVANATRPDGLRLAYAFSLPRAYDVCAMLAAARAHLAPLGVRELAVVGTSEAAVQCMATIVLTHENDAFTARAAVAEAIAALPRIDAPPLT